MDESAFITSLSGVTLENPLILGPGIVKMFGPEWVEALKSAAAAITIGSITKDPRIGNPGTTYWAKDGTALNSLGMPNPGAEWYNERLGAMIKEGHKCGKKIIVSVAGFCPEEYRDLAMMARDHEADIVELNLGCPNVWQGGAQKPIVSFVPDLVARILYLVTDLGTTVSVKLSPYTDPTVLQAVAEKINDSITQIVVTTNTIPNGLALEEGKPTITTHGGNPEGYAGISGKALKHLAMGQVSQLRKHLDDSIQIVGMGGISAWSDVEDLLAVGAKAVGITTAAIETKSRVFSDILMEAVAIKEL